MQVRHIGVRQLISTMRKKCLIFLHHKTVMYVIIQAVDFRSLGKDEYLLISRSITGQGIGLDAAVTFTIGSRFLKIKSVGNDSRLVCSLVLGSEGQWV